MTPSPSRVKCSRPDEDSEGMKDNMVPLRRSMRCRMSTPLPVVTVEMGISPPHQPLELTVEAAADQPPEIVNPTSPESARDMGTSGEFERDTSDCTLMGKDTIVFNKLLVEKAPCQSHVINFLSSSKPRTMAGLHSHVAKAMINAPRLWNLDLERMVRAGIEEDYFNTSLILTHQSTIVLNQVIHLRDVSSLS